MTRTLHSEPQPPPRDDAANADVRVHRMPWPPILLAASVAGALIAEHVYPLSWPGLDDWPARIIGLAFGIAGLALVTSAIWTLGRHQTTVMPHGQSTTLVTSGPYRWFRNPIYLGEVLMLLAIAEVTKIVWFVVAAAVFALAVTRLQILAEERHLTARFGDAYRDYKTRAKRWI
ncbi:MAG: methyltransferase family protein [Hyphomicrobium sp.]